MRRTSIFLTVVAMAMLFCIPGAQAVSINAGDRITINDGPGASPGGAFWVDILGQGTSQDFLTFCVEYNEHFYYGTTYAVTNLSDSATFGGGGAVNGADPISDQTRWLYYHYVTGDLNTYDPTLKNLQAETLGTAMQQAIWLLEEEVTSTSVNSLANSLIALANRQLGNGNNQGLDQVMVLNLNYTVGNTTYTVQDQLGLHAPAPVPEPATILLLGGGLLGVKVAGIRRRKRQ